MPKESRELMNEGENLLTICLDLRMSNSGAADPLIDSCKERYIKILKKAIRFWESGPEKFKRFDNAVLELCKATLEELGELNGL